MRRMSFALTERQFLDGTKTVTRRLGWKNLKKGDRLIAVRKCMGLKQGERQHVLGELEVLSVRREPLNFIDQADVIAEGFPEKTREEFIGMFTVAMKCLPQSTVTRIEFRKVDRHADQT